MTSFPSRAARLPRLGLGVSTEHGAADVPGALDPCALRRAWPDLVEVLEVGVETARGLDRVAAAWAASGWPTTYHFLDINLDDPDDFDPDWLDEVHAHIAALRPAWLCGDAGMWHLGRRDRGHMLLLPPILTADAVQPLADGVMRLREATGLEVLPENPPGVAWVGDLHLLDCAHLALYQRQLGHAPLTGLDAFPLDRVIELHIAGGAVRDHDGLVWVEDDHSPAVLDDTWQIVEHVLARAPNLKAIFIECERNPADAVRPLFDRVRALWPR